jgi:hypothetical protein
MVASEPGALPCGSWLQPGPKVSDAAVTPSAVPDADGAVAVGVVGVVVLGDSLVPQADIVTTRAAMAPIEASRWIFLTGLPPQRSGLSGPDVENVRKETAPGWHTRRHDLVTGMKYLVRQVMHQFTHSFE